MKVPTRATLAETVYATKGDRSVVIRRYHGHASDGFKTLYEPRPAAWVAYSPSQGEGWVKRWTGRNVARFERLWPEMVDQLRVTGWTVEVQRP